MRSASSPRSRPSSWRAAARSLHSAARRLAASAAARSAATRRCRRRSSSSTSSRARRSSEAGVPLGVVTSIVGYARGELWFEGRAGHAGTTPMHGSRGRTRRGRGGDPRASATPPRRSRARWRRSGELDVEPGAGNVIPGRVRLSVDVRAPDRERLDEVLARVGLEPGHPAEPVAMSDAAALHSATRSPRAACRSSSFRRAPATTRASSPRPASMPGCCSSGASTAA